MKGSDFVDIQSMIDSIFGNELYISIKDAVLFNVDGAWTILSDIYDRAILPVGYSLLVLYFLIELMEKTTHENLNFEHFLRLFIKLIVGKILMDNAIDVLAGLLAIGNSLATAISEKFGGGFLDGSDNANSQIVNITLLKESASDLNLFESIGVWARLITPQLANMVVLAMAKVVCWSRSIEIVVRAMLAPIAMPDIFSEGTRGHGFRYLKRFLAVSLQGVIILAIVIAMNQLNIQVINETNQAPITDVTQIPWNYFVTSIAMGFTTVTLIQRSKDWANDVVGA